MSFGINDLHPLPKYTQDLVQQVEVMEQERNKAKYKLDKEKEDKRILEKELEILKNRLHSMDSKNKKNFANKKNRKS